MARRDTDIDPTGTDRADLESQSARPTRRVIVGGLVFLLVLLGLAGAKSYRDLAEVQAREAELHRELDGTEAEITDLETRIDRLLHDPLTLERLAREELGMVQPGDVVIVLPEETPPADDQIAPSTTPAP